MNMQNPTTEKKLTTYVLMIHEVIDNFNKRSKGCMYRLMQCGCCHRKNKAHSCLWSSCPFGE